MENNDDRRTGAWPHELAYSIASEVVLIVLLTFGGIDVRHIPLLAGLVSNLLDSMRHGSAPITLTTLVINGVGEELFFRDVARRQLADVLSPAPPSSPN